MRRGFDELLYELDRAYEWDEPLYLYTSSRDSDEFCSNKRRYHDSSASSRRSQYSRLFNACERDDSKELRKLLRRGTKVDTKIQGRQEIIHLAAESDSTECLRLLIQAGADFNVKDDYGRTPLHYCCRKDAVESLDLLLRFGADPLVSDARGHTVIDDADFLRATRCVYALLKSRVRRRPSRGRLTKQSSSRTVTLESSSPRGSSRRIYQAHRNGAPLGACPCRFDF